MSIEWNDDRVARLKELCILGCGTRKLSEILTEEFREIVTIKAVEQAKYRFNFTQYTLEKDFDIKIFKEESLPDGDYMISCDYHSPYHHEVWINRYLSIADIFGIKKSVIIGDLYDMDFAKAWYTDNKKDLDEEAGEVRPVIEALNFFDVNYLVQGNHETRVGRMTDGRIQAKHLYHLFGGEIWAKKFRYSEFDKMRIGDKWLLVHPKSYSQVSPAVARRLAEKYHCNIINSHGHLVGMSYDRSGRFLAVDLGGMFDPDKVEYINMHTTTHPVWKNGFGMIRNGHFYHFTDATDWAFWSVN